MKITSSEPKYYLGISVNGLITSLGVNYIGRSKKDKKARCAITNVSMKDILNIIKEFENLPLKGYVQNRPKYEPTDSYFYLARQLDKRLMRFDVFNLHIDSLRTKITGTK